MNKTRRVKRFGIRKYGFFLPEDFSNIKDLRLKDRIRLKAVVKEFQDKDHCEAVGCKNCICYGNCQTLKRLGK